MMLSFEVRDLDPNCRRVLAAERFYTGNLAGQAKIHFSQRRRATDWRGRRRYSGVATGAMGWHKMGIVRCRIAKHVACRSVPSTDLQGNKVDKQSCSVKKDVKCLSVCPYPHSTRNELIHARKVAEGQTHCAGGAARCQGGYKENGKQLHYGVSV